MFPRNRHTGVQSCSLSDVGNESVLLLGPGGNGPICTRDGSSRLRRICILIGQATIVRLIIRLCMKPVHRLDNSSSSKNYPNRNQIARLDG